VEKQVEASIPEIDKETADCQAIPNTLKMHRVEVIEPFVVSTKFHYYSSISFKHQFTKKQINEQRLPESKSSPLPMEPLVDAIIPLVGNYYLVDYEGSIFPGLLTCLNSDGSFKIKCLQKAIKPNGSTWKWPDKTDEFDYAISDIKLAIEVPRLLPDGSRNIIFEQANYYVKFL